jgi:drug/metabolite transporter (DMT)-like permease
VNIRTGAFTALALAAFASNSILTRLALGAHEIDAATFSSIRLCAGAIALTAVTRARTGDWTSLRAPGISGALTLLMYALPFAFAYLRIGAAVGALVLFGVVQLTMIGYGVARGERPTPLAWGGILLAIAGLAALTIPSAARPDSRGLALMAIAGIAWAMYTILGKAAVDPVAANARSFLWSCPLVVFANLWWRGSFAATPRGIALAIVCGAVTSGLGYAVWYRALVGLKITQAAAAQLSVPVIAAFGAVMFLNESVSVRLALCSVAILCGVGCALMGRVGRA